MESTFNDDDDISDIVDVIVAEDLDASHNELESVSINYWLFDQIICLILYKLIFCVKDLTNVPPLNFHPQFVLGTLFF